jgi:hypothetical protein
LSISAETIACPTPAADDARVHRDRADLAEVLPQHVQRAAPDDLAVDLRDEELRHGLVQRDDLLGEQHAARVGVHEILDRPHVRGPGPAHLHRGRVDQQAGRTLLAVSDVRRAALLTLGCARNEVDSEEIAGRLTGSGWELVDDGADADVILVNTCGFVEQAKKDSIDTLLAASDVAAERGAKVVAVGCMAERYGKELADSLPEADAVLGFDAYPELAARLSDVLDGHAPDPARARRPAHPAAAEPGAAARRRGRGGRARPRLGAGLARTRLTEGPVANLKLASGCDRRCTFCAIPSFRGSFVSRPPDDVVAEAAWLGMQGVRELYLVSENSTSYGKDLPGGTRALVRLLPRLTHVPGIDRVRVSYLQPAEMRPDLLEVIATTPGRRPLLRPVVPARQRGRAAPDAPVRLPHRLPRPVRARPRPGPRGGPAVQLHRRLPRGDRGRRRGAGGVPRPGPAWTRSACSATPTRTAPRPPPWTATSTPRSSRSAWRGSARWPTS